MATAPDPSTETPRRPGRPRSARADRALLAAALAELLESGYESMSMEAVAARAGVGKATLYRRWSSREELVGAALRALNADVAIPDSGDVRADLIALMRDFQRATFATLAGPMLVRMIGVAFATPTLREIFMANVAIPRRDAVQAVLERGRERGQLRADLDLRLALPMIAGPIFYLAILEQGADISDPALPERIVDTLLGGIAA